MRHWFAVILHFHWTHFFCVSFAGCNSNSKCVIFPYGMLFLAYSHSPNETLEEEKRAFTVYFEWPRCFDNAIDMHSISVLCRFSQTKYCTLVPLAFGKKTHRTLHFHSIIRSSTLALAPSCILQIKKKHTHKIPNELTMMKIMHVCNVNVHTRIVSISEIFFSRWSGWYCWYCCHQHQQCCCRNPYGIR